MPEYTFTLPQLAGGFLAICAAITTVAAAWSWIWKAIKAARRPNAEQDARLSALEERMEALESGITEKGKDIDRIEKGTRITQRALLALLAHGIDGNSVDDMRKAKAELTEHLIDK